MTQEDAIKVDGSRIIFLTGAPLSCSLDWKEEDLCATLDPCYSQSDRKSYDPNPIATNKPAWRSLPLEGNHLPTGLNQASAVNGELDHGKEEASFLTAEGLSFVSSLPDDSCVQSSQVSLYSQNNVLSQFYEHSFAVHEDIPSSQIVGSESSLSTSFSTSYDDTSLLYSGSTDIAPEEQLRQAEPSLRCVFDLRDMPNAAHIRSIEPQTMTVNLVIGIIAIPQPRLIITRKGRRRVELIEMLVGDDTKAGFGINIWLHPHQTGLDSCDMRSVVTQLRPQDIVLIKNVALCSFRGKVYGQSLRKDTTTIDLLYRNPIDADDRHGIYNAQDLEAGGTQNAHLSKVKNVKQWVMTFIGVGANPRPHSVQNRAQGGEEANKAQLIALPPDTQP